MSSLSLASRLTRVAAGGLVYSVIANGMIYAGQTIIARELPRAEYASFAVIVSFLSLVAMFADLGWTSHLVKRFAQSEAEHTNGSPDQRGALLGTALAIKCFLAVVTGIAGVVIAALIYGASIGYLVLIGLATYFFSSRMLVVRPVLEAFIRAEGGFDKVLRLAALDALTFAALLFAWSQLGLTLIAVVAIYSLCHLPGFILLMKYLRQLVYDSSVRISFDWAIGKDLVLRAMPLTIGICFLTIHNMADTLILRELSNDHQVSAFAASFRIMAGLIFLPGLIAGVVVPEFVKLLKHGAEERATRLSALALQTLLTSAVFIALLISALAPIITNILLGSQYADTSDLIIIFGWMFLPVAFAAFVLELTIAVEKQKMFGYYTLTLAVVTVGGDLLVAGPFGAIGVTLVKFAAIVTGSLILGGLCMSDGNLRRIIKSIQWGRNVISLLIPLICLAVMTYLNVPIIVAGLITAFIFLGWSIFSGLIDLDRIASLVKSFKR
jgi:O-antigen/teichoic acid export membrane protein